jgi:hypothetical protein
MFEHRLVKTRNINQAAFLTALGAKLVEVGDIYPNNTFVMETHPFVLWYEKHVGFVPYKKYCNQRIRLKQRGRKLANLPENFTGKSEGFNFAEIAMVKPWSDKEKKRYNIT